MVCYCENKKKGNYCLSGERGHRLCAIYNLDDSSEIVHPSASRTFSVYFRTKPKGIIPGLYKDGRTEKPLLFYRRLSHSSTSNFTISASLFNFKLVLAPFSGKAIR